MITAEEANSLANDVEKKPVKVSSACDKSLNKAVLEAIESWKNKVDVVLWYSNCPDPDGTIKAYLKQNWYKNIKVTSDYPWYNESYTWTTHIIFNL